MSWLDTVFKFIGNARYNSVIPTLSSAQMSELQCDATGRLLVSTQPVNTLWSDAGAAASEREIKSAAGKLHQLIGRNAGTTTKYLFVFNHKLTGATRPATLSTAEMFVPLRVDPGASFSLSLDRARTFTAGLYWGISSTDITFSYDATATFVVSAEYE